MFTLTMSKIKETAEEDVNQTIVPNLSQSEQSKAEGKTDGQSDGHVKTLPHGLSSELNCTMMIELFLYMNYVIYV